MPILEVKNVRKVFKAGDVVALDGVSFSVDRGEAVAVIGPSGAGKTTLFRVLTRTVPIELGAVLVEGTDLYKTGYLALGSIRRRIGLIYQKHNLVTELSVMHNVNMGLVGSNSTWRVIKSLISGASADERERVMGALEEVGLADKVTLRAANLSGGEQQRVAIARLLVQNPDIILADEPVASIDPGSSERIMEIFTRLNDEREKTIICNLHDVDLAKKYFRRILAISEGRLVFDGPPAALTRPVLDGIYRCARKPTEEQTYGECACIEMAARKGLRSTT